MDCLDFKKLKILIPSLVCSVKMRQCTNFVAIDQTDTKILQFISFFQYDGRPVSWICYARLAHPGGVYCC